MSDFVAVEDKILALVEGEELVGIVYHDMKKRTQTIYSVSEMSMEEIKNLFNKKITCTQQ